MANEREFNVQALNTNGVQVGGTSTLEFDGEYTALETPPDGFSGSEYVDRVGLRGRVTLTTSDAAKAAALLVSVPASTTFYGKESGKATYHHYTINTHGKIIWTGIQRLSFRKDGYSQLVMTGEVIFQTELSNWRDVIALVAGAAAPTNIIPGRVFQPRNVGFDPDGAAPSITLLHTESIDLICNLPTISDYGDGDAGHTAVDTIAPMPVQVAVAFRDAKLSGGSHVAADVMSGTRGILAADLAGAGGAAGKLLTVNNLLWLGCSERKSEGYTLFTLSGRAAWRKNDTTMYAINTGGASDRVFSIL